MSNRIITKQIETPDFTVATLIGMEDDLLMYDDGEVLWSVDEAGMINYENTKKSLIGVDIACGPIPDETIVEKMVGVTITPGILKSVERLIKDTSFRDYKN